MIYVFRIISNEIEEFVRDIAIDAEHSFFKFHEAIQNACGYDPAQLASFYLADEEWDCGKEITLYDMVQDYENPPPVYIMRETKLRDLIHKKDDKLIYLFDFFTKRTLFIELKEIDMEKNLNAPIIKLKKGAAPSQLIDDGTNNKKSVAESNSELSDSATDFGELEDLNLIYGDFDDIF